MKAVATSPAGFAPAHGSVGIALKPDGKWGMLGDWWDGAAQAMDCVGKSAAGRSLDGREWNEMPEIAR